MAETKANQQANDANQAPANTGADTTVATPATTPAPADKDADPLPKPAVKTTATEKLYKKFKLGKLGFYRSKRSQKNPNGTGIFTYTMTSKDDDALMIYMEHKGDYYWEDEKSGKPVFQSTGTPLTGATLVMTENRAGNIVFYTLDTEGQLPLATNEELKFFAMNEEDPYVKHILATERANKLLGRSGAPVAKIQEFSAGNEPAQLP